MQKAPLVKEDLPSTTRQTIKIARGDLDRAAADGIITEVQAHNLWTSLASKNANAGPAFDFANLAWYSGAILVMLAMGWFMANFFIQSNDWGVLLTSLAYAAAFLSAGHKLARKADLRVPGGLFVTLSVGMVPFIIFSLESLTGAGDHLSGTMLRFLVEGGTLAAGFAALAYYRFPFLTAPLSVLLWVTTMDVVSSNLNLNYDQLRLLTMAFGLLMIAGAYMIDRSRIEDFGFWGYLVGATGFWTALTFTAPGGELSLFLYFAVNVLLMLTSVLLGRRIFVVYGAMGVLYYLGHLVFNIFVNSELFPLILIFLGVAIIYGGISYQRNRGRIERAILSMVPDWLKPWLPGASSRV